MQENIEKIEIVLENCEMITFEGKHIGDLDIENIKYSISRIACNAINEMFVADHISMSIHRDSNLNKKSEWTLGNIDEERNQFERILKHPDITSIYLYFKNNEEPKHFYVKWDGDDYSNNNQKSYINKFGDLFIVIDKENKLEDIFDLEAIEDAEYMDFKWSMYE